MTIKATQKFTRQAPRKVRLVANSVKKLPLESAVRQLGAMDRIASVTVLKVLRQAIANAMNNHGFKFEDLQLKNIIVNEGATYKRFRAVSRGRAHSIMKRSCHITVELEKPDVVPSNTIGSTTKAEKVAESVQTEITKPVEAKAETKKTAKKAPAKKAAKKSSK